MAPTTQQAIQNVTKANAEVNDISYYALDQLCFGMSKCTDIPNETLTVVDRANDLYYTVEKFYRNYGKDDCKIETILNIASGQPPRYPFYRYDIVTPCQGNTVLSQRPLAWDPQENVTPPDINDIDNFFQRHVYGAMAYYGEALSLGYAHGDVVKETRSPDEVSVRTPTTTPNSFLFPVTTATFRVEDGKLEKVHIERHGAHFLVYGSKFPIIKGFLDYFSQFLYH